jgi:hypothetical protein
MAANRPENFVDGRAQQLRKRLPERQNLGEPDNVKSRDGVMKMILQQEANDVREVMSSPAGRRFVWRILCELRMFGISHVILPDDPHGRETARMEGMRIGAKWVNDTVSAASRDNYLLMWQENFGEKQ